MAQNLPTTQKAANIRSLLEKSKNQMAMALPKHLTADRLLRVAMTSIQKTPKLLDCTPQSLLACVMTCAQLGLEPDQFLGQAYLVPFKDKKRNIIVCTLIPGYRGYIALARRSGEVKSVSSQVVYENDHFLLQYGIEEKLEHIPAEGERGNPKGAYVIFKYKDGGYSFDYMSKDDIEKIRKRSKTPDEGPWVTDWAEMAKKTVIKRHAKVTPLSVEMQTAIALEDRANMGESQADLVGMDNDDVIDADPMANEEDTAALLKAFADSIPEDINREILNVFLVRTAEGNKTTVDDVKIEAMSQQEAFWKVARAYQKQEMAKKAKESAMAPAPCPDDAETTYTKDHCDKCEKRQGCPIW